MRRAPAAAPASTSRGGGTLARYPQLLPGRGLGLLPRLRGVLPVRVSPLPCCGYFPPLPGLPHASARLTYFSWPKAPGLIDTEQMPAAPTLAPGPPSPSGPLHTVPAEWGCGIWGFSQTARKVGFQRNSK